MKIIVNESQYKKIILETRTKKITNTIKKLKDFFDELSTDVKTQIGLDINFLATWGVTIAGFVSPISKFMEGLYPELSKTELALLCTGIILTYYQSNKDKLKLVLDKIKEGNLVSKFNVMLSKAEELKNVFINFIDSLAIPLAKISNMLAYTFIIPIIPDLYDMAQGYDGMGISELSNRVLMFFGTTVIGNLIKKLLQEIVKRFKS